MQHSQVARRWLCALPLGLAAGLVFPLPARAANLRVDSTVATSGDGSNWPQAFKTLQEALDAAGDGDQIWVAVGTGGYYPTEVGEVAGLEFRNVAFRLRPLLSIYGGFLGNAAGGGEDERQDRRPEINETVLTGALPDPCGDGCNATQSCFQASGSPGCNCDFCCDAVCRNQPLCCLLAWDASCVEQAFLYCPTFINAFHVVAGRGVNSTAVLDGFTITAGVADGNNFFDCAVLGSSCNPVISYQFQGGGVILRASQIVGDNSGPIIARCTLLGNQASEGGGLATDGEIDSPFVIMSVFANLEFRDNSADKDGGGAWSGAMSRELWVNDLFACNSASEDGGGVYMRTGTELNITNGTFADNSAGGNGGGLHLEETAGSNIQTQIGNCIFYNNEDAPGGTVADAQLKVVPAGAPDVTLKNSDVQGGPLPSNVIDGGNNIEDDPLFVDATGTCLDNDYRLPNNSPAVDTGSNTAVPQDRADLDEDNNLTESTPVDLEIKLRIEAGIVDMGAYEYQVPGCPWSCGDSNGDVGVVDFLELLNQWGTTGSCDFDGGGVGVADFLALLSHWGHCPMFGQNPPQSMAECIERYGMEDDVVVRECICKVDPPNCPD